MRNLLLSCLLGLALPFQAMAQSLDAGVVIGNESALSIAIVPMPYEGSNAKPEFDVASVIRNNLNRSGQFRSMDVATITDKPTQGSDVSYASWKKLKQDFLVVGKVVDAADGNFSIEYELLDVAKQQNLLSMKMPARSKNIRRSAHQVADQIYEKILGVRGAFDTRIAYVTASGVGQSIEYRLMVADSDGFNPQTLVRSREPLLSPAWSPDGQRIAYVSFQKGSSAVYIVELATGVGAAAGALITSAAGGVTSVHQRAAARVGVERIAGRLDEFAGLLRPAPASSIAELEARAAAAAPKRARGVR